MGANPRHRILVMEHSYHGDTIGAMSVGARGVFNQAYAPLLFDVGTVPFPETGREQATLEALEAHCRQSPAAFIVEPLVLGAGGIRMYAPGVPAEMHAICRRHEVLFIADEVMTAWGRTGSLLACEQAGIVPDILCLSKGLTGGSLPLAVTLATPPIFEAYRSEDRARMFFHSSSYSANPIACAAANANLAIWRDEPVLDRIADLGERQQTHLDLIARHPVVRDARRLGTIAAFEIDEGAGSYAPARRAIQSRTARRSCWRGHIRGRVRFRRSARRPAPSPLARLPRATMAPPGPRRAEAKPARRLSRNGASRILHRPSEPEACAKREDSAFVAHLARIAHILQPWHRAIPALDRRQLLFRSMSSPRPYPK